MSANIVDVDAFTSPVVVPTDGDALTAASVIQGFQPLSDRTRNAKNRLDVIEAYPYGSYKVSGGVTAQDVRFTLTQQLASAGITLASNDVTVGQTGIYEVSFTCQAGNTDATDPKEISIRLFVNGAHTRSMAATRFSASTEAVCIALTVFLSLTSGDVLSLRSGVNDTFVTGSVLSDVSHLNVRRIR